MCSGHLCPRSRAAGSGVLEVDTRQSDTLRWQQRSLHRSAAPRFRSPRWVPDVSWARHPVIGSENRKRWIKTRSEQHDGSLTLQQPFPNRPGVSVPERGSIIGAECTKNLLFLISNFIIRFHFYTQPVTLAYFCHWRNKTFTFFTSFENIIWTD